MKSEYTMFPSPCGDMVLKWAGKVTFLILRLSFRPLAGIWF